MSRMFVGGAAGLVALIAIVGIALAAKPKTGYTYSNSNPRSPSVFFKAASGKKLTDFSASLAVKCKLATCGGFGGVSFFPPKSIKVKNGKFKVSGGIYGLAAGGKKGTKLGTQTVTGTFVSPTKVKGKVTSHVNLGQYKGVTKSYTATGSAVVVG